MQDENDDTRESVMERTGAERAQTYRELGLALAALLCLTGATVSVAQLSLGPFRIIAAMGIAALKAALVLMIFMNMKRAGRTVVITFLVTIAILAVFIGFIFFDVAYRWG